MEQFEAMVDALTTTREKVIEAAGVFLSNPKQARDMVAAWFRALAAVQDERKRVSLLYVMNDVVIKTSRNQDSEYLQAFSEAMDGVIVCLASARQELLLEELRKMVLVWEDGKIFAQQYAGALKTRIMEAIGTVLDEKSGAHAVQTYDLTRFLRKIETETEAMETAGEKLAHFLTNPKKQLSNHYAEPEKLKEVRSSLSQYREKCEKQLSDRTVAVMMLAREMRRQFEEYNRMEQHMGVGSLRDSQNSTLWPDFASLTSLSTYIQVRLVARVIRLSSDSASLLRSGSGVSRYNFCRSANLQRSTSSKFTRRTFSLRSFSHWLRNWNCLNCSSANVTQTTATAIGLNCRKL